MNPGELALLTWAWNHIAEVREELYLESVGLDMDDPFVQCPECTINMIEMGVLKYTFFSRIAWWLCKPCDQWWYAFLASPGMVRLRKWPEQYPRSRWDEEQPRRKLG